MTPEEEMTLAEVKWAIFERDWIMAIESLERWERCERPPVEAYIPMPSALTIADLEAKIQRMRDEDRGRPVVAAVDAIHAGRKSKPTEWPEVK